DVRAVGPVNRTGSRRLPNRIEPDQPAPSLRLDDGPFVTSRDEQIAAVVAACAAGYLDAVAESAEEKGQASLERRAVHLVDLADPRAAESPLLPKELSQPRRKNHSHQRPERPQGGQKMREIGRRGGRSCRRQHPQSVIR